MLARLSSGVGSAERRAVATVACVDSDCPCSGAWFTAGAVVGSTAAGRRLASTGVASGTVACARTVAAGVKAQHRATLHSRLARSLAVMAANLPLFVRGALSRRETQSVHHHHRRATGHF